MRKNGLPNLNSSKLFFTYFTNYITGINLNTIDEFYRIITTINSGNHKALLIFFHLTGIIIEVVSLRYYSCYFADTRSTFTVKLNGCCRCGLGKVNTFQINIAFSCCASRFCNALNRNFFNETFIICLHSIQTINHIVYAITLMCSRITKCHQRIKLL